VERRLKDARLRRFKMLADFEWDWPKQIHRPTVERVFTLDFLAKGENVVLVAPHGLGKTMFAKNLVHQAILAGHSARFSDRVGALARSQWPGDRSRARAAPAELRKPALVAIDEIGYLGYDAHAADLLFQVVSRRYEQRSLVVTTNLPFKQWNTVFPTRPVPWRSLIGSRIMRRLFPIEGESYRLREAEPPSKRAAPRLTPTTGSALRRPNPLMPPRLTHLDTICANVVLQQRLAKYLVLQCVRQSQLEDLHAGIAPSSATGDYTDVTVTSPFGSIPWSRVSRFNDEEMASYLTQVTPTCSVLCRGGLPTQRSRVRRAVRDRGGLPCLLDGTALAPRIPVPRCRGARPGQCGACSSSARRAGTKASVIAGTNLPGHPDALMLWFRRHVVGDQPRRPA